MVAIIIAVVFLVQYLFPYFFPVMFSAFARPFWRQEFAVNIGAYRSPTDLVAENESLRLELFNLKNSYSGSSIEFLESENRELLSMLGRASTSERHYKLASVLSRPPLLPYDTLIIDVGWQDGIASTSLVYASDKYLIGNIVEILPHTSKVLLFTSAGESRNVYVGKKHLAAIAYGRGGGQYEIDLPHGSDVLVGDLVSDGSLYDRAFGIVESIVTDPSNPFEKLLVVPPVNIFDTRFVFVDMGKNGSRQSIK